jgi:hypothetical protein
MARLSTAVTLALMTLAGTALAQSTVTFTVDIGGDNHAADWAKPSGSPVNTAFTRGLNPTTVFYSPVTWNVVAACSGIHNGDGLQIQGIANVVFNLELLDVNNNIVTTTRWYSTINNGLPQGSRGSLPDPFEKAAFCLGWDVDMSNVVPRVQYDGAFDLAAPPAGTGRIYDVAADGGPFMDRVQFPSTDMHGGGRIIGGAIGPYIADCNANLIDDANEINGTTDNNGNGILDSCEAEGVVVTAAPPGMLMGMGVGYSQFMYSQNSLGVGLAMGTAAPWDRQNKIIGLGALPLAEGQIDLLHSGPGGTALPSGTYTLKLTVPKDGQGNAIGQNVVPGSFNPTTGTGGFAVKADVVIEASRTFAWVAPNPCTGVIATAWESMKTHGGAGAIGLELSAADGSATTVEPRAGGLTQLKVTFSGPLTGFGSACFEAGHIVITGTAGLSVVSEVAVGNVLTINLTGSVNAGCYTIDLSSSLTWPAGADKTCKVAVLLGDVCGTKDVSGADMLTAKNKLSTSAATNPRCDVDFNGFITGADLLIIKDNIGTRLVCP